MHPLKFYESFEKVYFIQRLNRFVLLLKKQDGSRIKAYVPNTGRMEEFSFHNHPFFITPANSPKFTHKVVSTIYQNNFVFLDTVKVNDLFFHLIQNNFIKEFQHITHMKREVTFGASRFDFTLTQNHMTSIIEIKSCTLCHNGLALFPDAPTLRGQKHIVTLDQLASQNHYKAYVIFLILNGSAEKFIPNFHTDFDYGKIFLSAHKVNFKAFKVNLIDPVTFDLESIQEVPVDFSATKTHCKNKGAYLLLLENPKNITLPIGKLGPVHFAKGFYVYVGSALNSLDTRVKRHRERKKKNFWHIDYISSRVMTLKKVYLIRRTDKIESHLCREIEKISDGSIKNFGASDTKDSSHLVYFKESPLLKKSFFAVILRARTTITT